MKFLVIGLGSMGKRRVGNLLLLKAGDVIGFDIRSDRRAETENKYNIKTFKTFEEAMSEDPDALIISTSPQYHIQYALEAIKSNKHFFTELNTATPQKLDRIINLTKNKRIVAAPTCTMRHHPSIMKMKEIAENNEIGKILLLTYHSGEYLPDWHPWEDYRSYYVSSRNTGGGRDQVAFELDWIRWIMGEVKMVSCFAGKLSQLDADIYDTYQILLGFENGSQANILIDLIQRVSNRHCKALSEDGLMIWDWRARSVDMYRAKDNVWKVFYEREGYKGYLTSIEQMYVDELNDFVRAIKEEIVYPHSFAEERRVLQIMYAAEKSYEEGIHIKL